jgi:hypothetical protein
MNRGTCPDCSSEYEEVGIHLSKSGCSYPKLSEKQKETITGVLMGDGQVMRQGTNPSIRVRVVKQEYLNYLDSIFPFYGKGVKHIRTPEKSAEMHSPGGSGDPEKYSDMYSWWTMRSPEFEEFREWYSTGKKVFPEDIELSPTVVKHWYVCDGHYQNSGVSDYIELSLANEKCNKDKIEKYFSDIGIRVNSWSYHKIRFTVEDSKRLFEYMGDPVPGFEYKWPNHVQTDEHWSHQDTTRNEVQR